MLSATTGTKLRKSKVGTELPIRVDLVVVVHAWTSAETQKHATRVQRTHIHTRARAAATAPKSKKNNFLRPWLKSWQVKSQEVAGGPQGKEDQKVAQQSRHV